MADSEIQRRDSHPVRPVRRANEVSAPRMFDPRTPTTIAPVRGMVDDDDDDEERTFTEETCITSIEKARVIDPRVSAGMVTATTESGVESTALGGLINNVVLETQFAREADEPPSRALRVPAWFGASKLAPVTVITVEADDEDDEGKLLGITMPPGLGSLKESAEDMDVIVAKVGAERTIGPFLLLRDILGETARIWTAVSDIHLVDAEVEPPARTPSVTPNITTELTPRLFPVRDTDVAPVRGTFATPTAKSVRESNETACVTEEMGNLLGSESATIIPSAAAPLPFGRDMLTNPEPVLATMELEEIHREEVAADPKLEEEETAPIRNAAEISTSPKLCTTRTLDCCCCCCCSCP